MAPLRRHFSFAAWFCLEPGFCFGGWSLVNSVELLFAQWFDRVTDAIENERKLKKWRRAKKEAFMRGEME